MDNNSLAWIMGSFNHNGYEMPIANVIASFNEAKAQFVIEIEEMEDEISLYLKDNPTKEYAVQKRRARIQRLKNIMNAYEYMMAYHKYEVKEIKRMRAEEKKEKTERLLEQENLPVSVAKIIQSFPYAPKK